MKIETAEEAARLNKELAEYRYLERAASARVLLGHGINPQKEDGVEVRKLVAGYYHKKGECIKRQIENL